MDYIEVPLQPSEPPFESAVESLRNRCGVQYYSVVYDISFVAVILRLPFREVASLKLHRPPVFCWPSIISAGIFVALSASSGWFTCRHVDLQLNVIRKALVWFRFAEN